MKKLAMPAIVFLGWSISMWSQPVQPIPSYSAALEQQAATGDDASQQALAYDYYFGKGVGRSFEKAAQWYERSAHSGNPYSAFSLAFMYEKGQGLPAGTHETPRDAAFPYYLQAAQAGLVDAMLKVAKDYDSAEQGEFPGIAARDHTAANAWYAKAKSGASQKPHVHRCTDYWEVGLTCPE